MCWFAVSTRVAYVLKDGKLLPNPDYFRRLDTWMNLINEEGPAGRAGPTALRGPVPPACWRSGSEEAAATWGAVGWQIKGQNHKQVA
jgi:hypothetical protein